MALPSSGTLTIEDIANEFGGVVPHDLSEYYGADTGVPTSGELSISDFYGTENTNAVDSMSGSDWANMGSIGSPVSSGTGFASGTSLYWGSADAPFTSAANNTPKYSEGVTGTGGASGFTPLVNLGSNAFEYSQSTVSIYPYGWVARSLTIPVQKLRKQTYNWSLNASITGTGNAVYDPNPAGYIIVTLEAYDTWNSAGANSYVSNLQNTAYLVDTGFVNPGSSGWQASYSGQFTNSGEYVMLKVYLYQNIYYGVYGPYTGIKNFGLTKA